MFFDFINLIFMTGQRTWKVIPSSEVMPLFEQSLNIEFIRNYDGSNDESNLDVHLRQIDNSFRSSGWAYGPVAGVD